MVGWRLSAPCAVTALRCGCGSEYVHKNSVTVYHPVGTCKMGRVDDPTTVVDARGRVKGVARLRVADASIMPTIIRYVR